MIHRDIKPENIFLSAKDDLILGDPGIAFLAGVGESRVTSTLESVGSAHWMPPWTMGKRVPIEEIRPTFDVYSLGKLIYAMISKENSLPLWYHEKPENDLELIFKNDLRMKPINRLLRKCVVEEEESCLPDARVLIDEVTNTLSEMEGLEATSSVRHTLMASREGKRRVLQAALEADARRMSPEETLDQIFDHYVEEFTEWHVRILKLCSEPGAHGERVAQAAPPGNMGSLRLLLTVAYKELEGNKEFQDQMWKDLFDRGLVPKSSLESSFRHGSTLGPYTTDRGEQFLRFLERR